MKARVVLPVTDRKPADSQNVKTGSQSFVERFLRPIKQCGFNLAALSQFLSRGERVDAGALSYWPKSAGPLQVSAFLLILAFAFIVVDPLMVPIIRLLPREITSFFAIITEFATAKIYLVPVGVVALVLLLTTWKGMHRRLQWSLLQLSVWLTTAILVIGVGGLLVNVLKRMIGRGRPTHFDELGAYGFDHFTFISSFASFPSGHATTAGSVIMLALVFLPKWRKLLLVVAVVFAASRVILGVHYVSDVILGLCLGALFARMVCVYFARRGLGFYGDKSSITGVYAAPLRANIVQERKEIRDAFTATFNRQLPLSDNLSIKPENLQKD